MRTVYRLRLVLPGQLVSRPESNIDFDQLTELGVIDKVSELLRLGYWVTNDYLTQVVPPARFIRFEITPPLPK